MITKLVIFLVTAHFVIATPCNLRAFKTGLVCVCNETSCDTLEFKLPKPNGDVLVITSSNSGLRFHQTQANFNGSKFTIPNGPFHYENSKESRIEATLKIVSVAMPPDEPLDSVVNIAINRTAINQKIIGFGGAMTGAVSYNLISLSNDALRAQVFRSYYSKTTGIGYTMMRLPIGGCDFDLAPWAYNEFPEHDPQLTSFTKLDKRDLEKLQHINDIKRVTGNSDIKFFGAAWSPPKWMKTNNDWAGLSALREEYYQTWADYHIRWVELMTEKNLTIWAISTGNEPLNGNILGQFVHFMSLGWSPVDQGKWVGENLGPALKNSKKLSNVKVLAGEDQRYIFPWWFEQMYRGSTEVSKYVDGLAVHWYANKIVGAGSLDRTADMCPDKFIISTEACLGDKPWSEHKPIPGYWPRAESYATSMIEDLNHHVSAWVDWNLLLNTEGGPNYAENTVDAPIIANGTEIFKQPIFYALGHFSRFILPDSVKIRAKSSHKLIRATAFLRPDGYIALIICNTARHYLDVNVFDKTYGALRLGIPGKSIHSLLFK